MLHRTAMAERWTADTWHAFLSISRSTPLHRFYSLCGTVLQNFHEARYLGINLSDELQWVNHIRSIAAKFSSTLGLLKRNLSKCPQKLRERAYISLIRSRLEYCVAVWDPYLIKDINILEGIQRRAARFVIQDHSRFISVSSLLKDLSWAPLKARRRDIRLAIRALQDFKVRHACSSWHYLTAGWH